MIRSLVGSLHHRPKTLYAVDVTVPGNILPPGVPYGLVTARPVKPLVCRSTVAVKRSTASQVPSCEVSEGIGRGIGNDLGSYPSGASIPHADNSRFAFRPPFHVSLRSACFIVLPAAEKCLVNLRFLAA